MEDMERIEEQPKESISGLRAEINQMKAMIKENERMIGLGDDVDGRTNMIQILSDMIIENTVKLNKLLAEAGVEI